MPVAYKTIRVTKSIWNLIPHIVALFVRAPRPVQVNLYDGIPISSASYI